MYYYIYDSFLEHARYRKIIDRLELRLADLGIVGEAIRVRPLRNLEEIVLEGLNMGKRTIVALGNDHTFSAVANVILNQNKISLSEIVCGFIPLDKPNAIGESLGIPLGPEAADVISSRIIQTIDLGRVGKGFFFTKAIIGFGSRGRDKDKNGNFSYFRALRYNPQEVILKLDDRFQIRVDLFQASIVNLPANRDAHPKSNPTDGIFNVFVTARLPKLSLVKNLKLLAREQYYALPKTSIFKARRVGVFPASKKNFNILADNHKLGRSPAVVQPSPQRLKVIVGKDRVF